MIRAREDVGYVIPCLDSEIENLTLIGTKVVCSEGDCGSCTVLVGRVEREGDRAERALDGLR